MAASDPFVMLRQLGRAEAPRRHFRAWHLDVDTSIILTERTIERERLPGESSPGAGLTRSASLKQEQSFVFLTLHKAGSAFASEIVRDLFMVNGWASQDPATQAFVAGLNEYDFIKQQVTNFNAKRTFFGSFRAEPVSLVPKLPSLTPIIHVRDPRDCLVSYYYSICYSHVLPGPGPERERVETLRDFYKQRSVDDFCLEVLTNGDRSFKLLRWAAESSLNAVVSRYEDMVTDFSGWLKGLVRELPIQIDDGRIESLDPQNQSPKSEDVYSHKRQVTPGDFRRKLLPTSQSKLTEFFRDDLAYFGYSTEI